MIDFIAGPWSIWTGISLLAYLIIYGCKRILCIRFANIFGKTKNKWDDLVVETLEQTTHLFMFASGIYIGFKFLDEHPADWVTLNADRTYFIILMIQACIWVNHLIGKWIDHSVKAKHKRNPAVASSVSLIQLLTKFILITVVFLFTLHNLGIKITTILAGLGVGGLAVALAVQKILGDLFSSLSIVMDKPFMVGDFITLGEYMGEVEKIGLKTTRLRSLGGEQIIISNSDLLANRIRNYQRLRERRVILQHSLVHGLSAGDIQKAVSVLSAIINSHPKVRLERCHFTEIGKNSLNFETVYWVLSSDHLVHMDLRQKILLEICQAFATENLTFAYPTQTLFIQPTSISLNQVGSVTQTPENSQSLS